MNSSETIDTAADVVVETAADAAAAGASQLKKFLDDVEDLIRRVTPLGDADLARMRARVETSLHSVRKATDRQVKQAIGVSSKAARATDAYVHESPWKAIGIAALAALAVGSLLMNRREH